ncbi:MAG: hypothetical protein R3E66_20530 [bacterium]
MSTFTPARNPLGQNLGVSDILLQRPDAPSIDVVATFKNAFEMVKTYPAETVGGMVAVMVLTMIVNFVLAIVTGLVMGVVVTVLTKAGDPGSGMMTLVTVLQVIVQLFTTAIITVISAVLMGGYNIMWLRIVRGEEVSFNNIMEVKPFVIPPVLTTILMQVAIFFGYLALIVPGVILAFGLCMTQIVVVDKNLKLVDALKGSWAITNGHKMSIFIFGILATVINVIGMIPCGLGMLVTIPMSLGALIQMYDILAVPGRAYAEGEDLVGAFE